MKILTRRQENIWRNKMIELEKTIIRYYTTREPDHPEKIAQPDGSFCMSAFKDGYYLRGRKENA